MLKIRFFVPLILGLEMFYCCCNTQNSLKSENKYSLIHVDIGLFSDTLNYSILDTLFILVPPTCSITKGYKIIDNEIIFSIVLDKGKKISFLSTVDNGFITNEEIKVGMNYSEIAKMRNDSKVKEVKGWAKYIKLKSGWNAGFPFETDIQNSKVTFLFKFIDPI